MNDGKTEAGQEDVGILYELACDGHTDSVEKLSEIFLDQDDYKIVEKLLNKFPIVNDPRIHKDGAIETSDGKRHKTPSGAAKHLNNYKPVDGWIAWRLKNSGEQLSTLRAKLSSSPS